MARILVVDDDPVSRLMARHVLTRAGHTVVEADDGATALAEIERVHSAPDETPFDLILSDEMMPNISGLELRRRLGSECPAPFVLLTGSVSISMARFQGLDAIAGYLTKPTSSKELLAEVERLIGHEPAP